MLTESPFPEKQKIVENEFAYAIYDAFPVSPGHALIVPRRIVADYLDLAFAEKQAMWKLVEDVRLLLMTSYKTRDFNIGINCGEHAGQTIGHVHIHLIPRYPGDTPNPRGGVRGVIQGKQQY
jgi:ATP adenylyltransferase